MRYDFYMPVRVLAGPGVVSSFNFSHLGKSCLIMTGGSGAKKSGALDDILSNLIHNNIEYFIYDGIRENPSVESCYDAAMKAREHTVCFIVAVGGGSVIDAAKAASVFVTNDFSEPMDIYSRPISKKALPLVAVGTTAGTGSEVTAVSVLTMSNSEGLPQKKSVKSARLYPLYSLVDSKYTHSLNWNITLNTALDAICHAVESLYSKKSGAMEQNFSCEALSCGWPAIKKAHWQVFVENREIEPDIRETLMYASIMAGYAINGTGTCYPHALGYNMTSIKNIPHGKACALFISDFLATNTGTDRDRDRLLQKALGCTIEEFLEDLDKLLGEKPVLSADDVEYFTANISGSASLANSIVPIQDNEIEKRYLQFYRK